MARSRATRRRNEAPEAPVETEEAIIIADRCESILQFLSELEPPEVPAPGQLPDAVAFPACSPPDIRIPPQFVIPLRRPMLLCSFDVPIGDGVDTPFLQLACVKLASLEVSLGIDLRFEQIWNLQRLGLGDLASTMGLAPSEQLTLEFQQSQRRVLEQSKVDSAEEMDSIESTTIDKEAFNAARSSSKTENWHVDGSGSFGIGSLKIGADAGVSESTTTTSQSSIQQITEATKKSAHSLRTLHKIEVRGVTEGLIQNRMTRVVKNPYRDRTLSLNVFQLIKHFFVKTQLVELRPVMAIQITLDFNGSISKEFGKNFVLGNSDFLQEKLLDQSLIDDLPEALKGAKPLLPSADANKAIEVAELALHYLFDEPDVFHMPRIPDASGDPNVPANSFNASIAPSLGDPIRASGLEDALVNDLEVIFTILGLFYKVYQDAITNNILRENAVSIVTAIAGEVGDKWEKFIADPQNLGKIKSILDPGSFTEIFRRLSGFLAIIKGMLEPLLDSVKQENEAAQAHELEVLSLNHLLEHLQCEVNYYTQQFLVYIARLTNNQAIVDFINRVIDRIPEPSRDLIPQVFDIERAFIDRQQIIIPAFNPLTDDQVTGLADQEFRSEDIKPTVVEVDLPCDGIHLEVAPGACILQDLPPQEKTIEFTIHDASLKVTAP